MVQITLRVWESQKIFKGSVHMDLPTFSYSSQCLRSGSQLSYVFDPRTCSYLGHWIHTAIDIYVLFFTFLQIGAHGKPVVFLHPKDCGGVLVEMEEA